MQKPKLWQRSLFDLVTEKLTRSESIAHYLGAVYSLLGLWFDVASQQEFGCVLFNLLLERLCSLCNHWPTSLLVPWEDLIMASKINLKLCGYRESTMKLPINFVPWPSVTGGRIHAMYSLWRWNCCSFSIQPTYWWHVKVMDFNVF